MSENGLVTVTIDGREVQAEPGRLLIDVAEEMGIFVPRFCYHPGMKSVAVCRMCLVEVEGIPKLAPSCATPVADGMVVNTKSEQAAGAQETMLEFLLINHPLDCPICDRGGECPLQDQTYKHGPGQSRYVEPKRTFEKALDISNLVVLDRERCVLCWRCVRFSDEVAGDRFISLVDRGPGTQVLNFSDEPFDSYFSGNTIQICPVGALTASTYRFVSRPWDLKTSPSVCSYCSVGCPVTNEARSDKLVRCQALPNENVNDFWICDKGRFAFHYVDSNDRLTTPLVRDGEEFTPVGWGDAFRRAAEALSGKEKVGVIAGGHLPNEDAHAVSRFARKVLDTADVDSRIQDAGAPYEMALDYSNVAGSTATINDLEGASTIVWAGPDPKETLPVLYLRLRKAVCDLGRKLIVVSPRRMSLDDFASEAIRCEPGGEAAAVASLGDDRARLDDPLVLCWGPSAPGRDESALFRSVLALASDHSAGVLVCPPHAGSQGMIDMGVHPGLDAGYVRLEEPGRDTRAMLEAAAAGELEALVIVGADLIADFPDPDLARSALEKVPFSLVIELFPTETALLADVVLPSVATPEREGTFTNLERRIQRAEALISAPGTAREPWRALEGLATAMGDDWGWRSAADVWEDIRKTVPSHKDVDLATLTQEVIHGDGPQLESGFEEHHPGRPLVLAGPGGQYPKGYRSGAPFQTGQNWPLSWELRAFEARERPGRIPLAPESVEPPESVKPPEAAAAGGLRLYTGRMLYDAGAMVARSKVLAHQAPRPFVEMNDEDVKELGLTDGDEVVVTAGDFQGTARLRVADIARGTVFVPYGQPGLAGNALVAAADAGVEVRAR